MTSLSNDSQMDMIQQVFSQNGYKVLGTDGFGSCFFESIVGSLKAFGQNVSGSHVMLRDQVANFLIANRHEQYHPEVAWTFQDYFETTLRGQPYDSFEEYVTSLRHISFWADELAIQATATFLKRHILCFVGTCNDWTSFGPVFDADIQLANPLCIANIGNCHFVGSMPSQTNKIGDSEMKVTESKKIARIQKQCARSLPQVNRSRIVICTLSESAFMICFLGFNKFQMRVFTFQCQYIYFEELEKNLSAATALLVERNILQVNQCLKLLEMILKFGCNGVWVCGTGSRIETDNSVSVFKNKTEVCALDFVEHIPDFFERFSLRILKQMCV